MIKLFTLVPNKEDGTSFYRGQGVIGELHKSGDVLNEFIESFDIRKLKGADAIFLQRPDMPEQVRIAQMAKRIKIPLIVDYDDHLLDVPYHNPYNFIYKAKHIDYHWNIKKCLELADLVWVATKELKDIMEVYNKNIYVVPNAFDDYCYSIKKEFSKNKVVLWRGSKTHSNCTAKMALPEQFHDLIEDGDLEQYAKELEMLIEKNKDFEFVFMSDVLPDWLEEIIRKYSNCKIKQAVHIYDYMLHLEHINPCLTLIPLVDSRFNRAKSCIAKIETVACGGLVLAPDWEEWKWNSDEQYLYTQDNFYKKGQEILNKIRDNDSSVKEEYEKSRKYLIENRLLSGINKKRCELLKTVIRG